MACNDYRQAERRVAQGPTSAAGARRSEVASANGRPPAAADSATAPVRIRRPPLSDLLIDPPHASAREGLPALSLAVDVNHDVSPSGIIAGHRPKVPRPPFVVNG